ncbi:MAG: XTP/dITP diphosphatase [Polyangia bacterium]|jgi:XTP/dITP diphosphohydrolase|nr:XTP/dITP diphosphatase [Polyangia bacterium]
MTRKLVFATRNRGKLVELEALVEPLGIQVLSAADLPSLPEVEEDGATFEENAVKKALAVARASGLPSLADDSGLVVDALGGAPGVRSARFAGPSADDRANNEKLLELLGNLPSEERGAHFCCHMALADPASPGGELVHTTSGRCDGQILCAPRGEGGFGYDPLFLVPELGQTFAELPREVKNRISHRAKALLAMRELLEASLGAET